MSPLASETIGRALHALTGKWNLEDYIGHDCYVVAASAIVYNALGRLQDDRAMQSAFKQYVERPATLCIPLMLATFAGERAAIYRPDFFDVPTDFWLSTYWLLLCGMLIYLLGYGSRALLILRRDPRSRRIANVHLFASRPASWRARFGSSPPMSRRCRPSKAAPWCGSSPAPAARGCGRLGAFWRIKTRWFNGATH